MELKTASAELWSSLWIAKNETISFFPKIRQIGASNHRQAAAEAEELQKGSPGLLLWGCTTLFSVFQELSKFTQERRKQLCSTWIWHTGHVISWHSKKRSSYDLSSFFIQMKIFDPFSGYIKIQSKYKLQNSFSLPPILPQPDMCNMCLVLGFIPLSSISFCMLVLGQGESHSYVIAQGLPSNTVQTVLLKGWGS